MDAVGLLHNQAERLLEEVVTNIARDQVKLYSFAYELRRHDHEDEFTLSLLDGQVQPSILVDIIVNNKWDGEEMMMPNNYRLSIGKGDCTL